MALNLFDYLTPLDNKRIENYIKTWGCEDYIGNEIYLQDWAKDKKKLFHLLGGKLILSKPYKIEMNEEAIRHAIIKMRDNFHFFDEFEDYLFNFYKKINRTDDFYEIEQVFFHNLVEKLQTNKIKSSIIIDSNTSKKPLKIQEGMGFLKAHRKLLGYFDVSEIFKSLFEEMRIEHSKIMNNRLLQGTLNLSIFPLDYLTMSDNDNDWSSCMSWSEYGCYHNGTVEMMTSNIVICAYLSGKNSYNFSEDKKQCGEEWEWNNKKWRQLFYCTKDIILAGKAYPYCCEKITKDLLNWLRELARENWHTTYKYGIESYKDMIHVNNLTKMNWNKTWIRTKNTTKHNIIFDTKAMYNDMLNDCRYNYLCIRNKVKKNLVLCASGKTRCVCCGKDNVVELIDYDYLYDYSIEDGEPDLTEDDYYDYNARYSGTKKVLCSSCYRKHNCDFCGNESHNHRVAMIKDENGYEKNICKKCFTEKIKYCPTCGNQYHLRKTHEYNSTIDTYVFGLYTDTFDPPLDFINDIQINNKKPKPANNRIMIFNECKDCTKKRIKNEAIKIKIPFDRDNFKDSKFEYFSRYIYVKDGTVKERDVKKYHLSNLKGLTEEEFNKIFEEQKI